MRQSDSHVAAASASDTNDRSATPRGGAASSGDILSCVVDAYPGRGPEIAARLGHLAGVEVHGGVEVDRLVVTIEDSAECSAIDRLGEVSVTPGVMAAILVYHCDGRALHETPPAAMG